MKSIYTYYKERLIEISGKNRSIYTRSFSKKTGYDLGRLLARDTNREDAFVRFLWSDGREPFDLFSSGDKTLRKIFDSDAEEKRARRELETQGLTGDEKDSAVLRLERQARQAFNANVAKEVTAVRTLKRVSRPEAINVGFNLGKASGGSVGDHLHLHVVPRWECDSNFMTIIDGTKVLPALLRDTRAVLAAGWQEIEEEDKHA